MKKLVLAALAIGAMAACTKSNVQFEQPGEIAFQPVAQKATKAAVTGTGYPIEEKYNFNVWAWWGAKEKEYDDASTFNTVYIDDQPFEYRSASTLWGGAGQSYYWPTTGSLFFAGYSPASIQGSDDNSDDCEVSYDKNNKRLTVENYQQSIDISQTVDLMWFHLTDKSYDRTDASVPVKFHHALSWLTFRVNLKDDETPELWKVKSVKLRSIETKANFTATRTTAADDQGTALWTNHSNTEDITVFSTEVDDKHRVTYVDTPYAVGINDDSVLENTTNGVLVIPQKCDLTRAQLVIEFEQMAPSDIWVPQTKFLSLGNEWLPGKHYIYTITFGAEEILISPIVVDWTSQNVADIPVQ